MKQNQVYIASDHGGLALKSYLALHLSSRGFTVHDMGPGHLVSTDDYPDYAAPVARMVAKSRGALGILCCRSGQGMCIAANKIKGIRAASAWTTRLAAASRSDDHANVLCLAADYVGAADAERIAEVFLKTEPSTASRHLRRVRKVTSLEKQS